MKSKLIAISLLAATGMFADDDNGYYNKSQRDRDQRDQRNNNYVDPCCPCPVDCCEPCCVPKPRPCIDCECYVPKFYDLQCDWGIFVDVEFLYWYARETHLPYALRVEGAQETFVQAAIATPPLVLEPEGRKYLNTDWEPGFRIGLGWNSECDGWDWYANWTWYRNSKRNSSDVDQYGAAAPGNFFFPLVGQSALINPWVNASFAPGTGDLRSFDTVSARWKLYLNQIDLELGRKYWLSKCFAMRPYAGLRGAWTKTRFNTRSSRTFVNEVGATDDTVFRDRFTNRYWGVGLLAGLQPTWYFTSNFALYSNMDASLIWGEFKAKKRESYSEIVGATTSVSYSNRGSDDFFMMQAILDLGIGIRWEEFWCCDRYRTALDIGWEHHIWFDHNHRLKTMDFLFTAGTGTGTPALKGFRTFDETPGNLMFGGLVIRVRFDF